MSWDVSEYVVQFFVPCVVVGAILPAAGAIVAGVLRSALVAVGYIDSEM